MSDNNACDNTFELADPQSDGAKSHPVQTDQKAMMSHYLHMLTVLLAIVNAWIGYRQDAKAKGVPMKDILQLMDFRLEIAQTYLAAFDQDSEQCDTG